MTERERKTILGSNSDKAYRMFDKFCHQQTCCTTCQYSKKDYCLVQWMMDRTKEALTIQTN